jgi:sugar lactone lactonase YvrE
MEEAIPTPPPDRSLSPASLEEWGIELHRPECVLGTPSGDLFVPDWRGGVGVIRADGSQKSWFPRSSPVELRPNAIAITPDGGFLLANLGDAGGVWKLSKDGDLEPFLTEVDGAPLPPTNFVTVEGRGRVWISVSTRHLPRQLAWRPEIADGFIVLVDENGPRIVANGLHYTNEVRPDPTGRWLYVVETFARRLLRFPIETGGELGASEHVVQFGEGTFPDGFAFDSEGGIWITSLVSNRLLRCGADGRVETILEDSNPAFLREAEGAFREGRMNASHLAPIPGTKLQQLTSVAFSGADLRTVALGSLHGVCVYRFRSAIAGAPPPHWNFPIP